MYAYNKNKYFNYFLFAIRIFLGCVFIFSAISKLSDLNSFRWALVNLQLIYWTTSIFLSYAIPLAEIILGLLLLIGLFKKFAAIHLGLLIIAFGWVSYFAWKHSEVRDCNCLGKLIPLHYGIPHIILLVFLLCLVILVFLDKKNIWSLDSKIRRN